MIANLFILWIILTPFIIWNGFFEGPKVFVFLIGGFLLTLFWIIRFFKIPLEIKFGKADLWLLGWLAILLISSLFGVHPLDSILGGSYRHQGVIFFFALFLIGKTITILDSSQKDFLKKAIGISVIVEGVIILLQYVGGQTYFGKQLGTLGEPNAVAGFLSIGVSFLGPQNLILPILVLITVLLEGSKSGFLSFAISGLSLLIVKISKKIFVLIVLAILIISLGIGYQYLGAKLKYLTAPVTSLWQLEQEDRVLIWRMAINKIGERPLLGWGAESSEVVFDSAYRESGMPLLGIIVDRAHNLFLDVTMWSGVLGLIFFSGWLYVSFKNLKNLGKKLAFLSFLAYAMFQPLSVVHWILMVIIVNI